MTLLLTGCVTTGVQELPLLETWEQRQQTLGALENWSLRGRLGIKTPEDASSGNLRWVQEGVTFDAQIDGPLGIGGVHAFGSPEAVTLEGSRIDTTTVRDPGTELYRQTGLEVPIAGLRYWLLGVPIPDVPAELVRDGNGLAERIEQGRWRIEFREYRTWSLNPLPRRIVATSAETRLTIVVRDWDIREANNPVTSSN
ncbi:MAG: lipoprotein insertase outer membrane protein LolB [Pseudomonadota bacterium]